MTFPSMAGIYIRQIVKHGVSHWLQEIKWRKDKRCGSNFLLPDGTPAQCNPAGPLGRKNAGPCCSEYGYCGGTQAHCKCAKCIDYSDPFQNAGYNAIWYDRKFVGWNLGCQVDLGSSKTWIYSKDADGPGKSVPLPKLEPPKIGF